MRYVFLLDENQVVTSGEHTETALRIWNTIRDNCHHKVAMDQELNAKYQQKLHAKRRGGNTTVLGSQLPRVIASVLIDSDKTVWVEPRDDPALQENVRDVDDRFLVNIAIEATKATNEKRCVLISTDEETVDDFNQEELTAQGLSAVQPAQGLELAMEQP